jgi:hypothetical protein
MKSSNVLASQDYCIDPDNVGFILAILRDKLYTNKPLAVVREYICNAVDAHIEANKLDTSIKISAPTILDPFFRVKDRGLGLSPDSMDNVFRKFGNTTKRGDINTIGENGIGAKCAFALTDMFTIVSYYEGTKYTYCSYIDGASNKLDLLETAFTEEENGIEIIVPISDIELFIRELTGFLNYFETSIPLDINITLPLRCCRITTENYTVYEGYSGNVFILIKGCAYKYNYRGSMGDFIIKGDRYPHLFTIGPGREYIDTTTEANQLINVLLNEARLELNKVERSYATYDNLDMGIKIAELFNLHCFSYGPSRRYFDMDTYRILAAKKVHIYNDTTAVNPNVNSYIKSRGLQDTHLFLNKGLQDFLNKHPELKFTSVPLSEIKLLPIVNRRPNPGAKSIKASKTIMAQIALPYLKSRKEIQLKQSSTAVYTTTYLEQLKTYKRILTSANISQVITDYLQAPVYTTKALKSVEKESNWVSDKEYLETLMALLNKEMPDLYKALISFIYLRNLCSSSNSIIDRLKLIFPDSNLINQIYNWMYYYAVNVNFIKSVPDYIYEDIKMQFPLILLSYSYSADYTLDDIKDFLLSKQQ